MRGFFVRPKEPIKALEKLAKKNNISEDCLLSLTEYNYLVEGVGGKGSKGELAMDVLYSLHAEEKITANQLFEYQRKIDNWFTVPYEFYHDIKSLIEVSKSDIKELFYFLKEKIYPKTA